MDVRMCILVVIRLIECMGICSDYLLLMYETTLIFGGDPTYLGASEGLHTELIVTTQCEMIRKGS